MPKKHKARPGKTNFIFQGGILAIAGVITRIIGLFYRVPVTNIIGDEGNGYYAAAYQIYNIMLLISSYSLPIAISKIVSARYSRKQYGNSSQVFKGGLLFAFVSGGIVCLLVFFEADFFAGKLMSEQMSAIALRIFAPTLLIVAIMGVIRGYFQGMGTMIPTAVSQIIEQIVNAVVSILAARALYGYGMKVAALLQNDHYAPAYGAAGSTLGTSAGALAGLLFLIFMLLVLSSTLSELRRNEENPQAEPLSYIVKLIIMTAVPVIMSTAIYNISDVLDNGIFNKIMTLKGRGIEKTSIWGVYSGKYKLLMNVPIALSNAMSASTVPTLAASMAAGDLKAARRRTNYAMRFTMLIAFPCAVGLAVLADPILTMLFSGEQALAAALIRAGAVSIIFFSISTLSNGILQGINRMQIPVINSVLSLIVHLALLYVMLDKFDLGIYAVLIGNTLFALFMCILNQIAIRRFLNYAQEIKRTFLVPFISAALMGVIVFGVYKLFALFAGNMLSTLISIVIGVGVYSIAIMKLGGVREAELKEMPGGGLILRITRIFHIL
ncbi:MAG: polysaccharide biosynthesis protein [Lachnospiraceae bacterium]|nr:polysaccharide biosynthesis protein [Lachnospiraceae bacterium]